MYFSLAFLALIPVLPFSLAAPTERAGSVPLLPDGLLNPNPEQLQRIEKSAHGTLPGLPLPTNTSAVGATNLQLFAFYEFVETVFFHQLLGNITRNVQGNGLPNDVEREFALRSLSTIVAQEQEHALSANTALDHFGIKPIEPSNGDEGLVRLTASIIGNKGAQHGWFRVYQDKHPGEIPTMTTSGVNFAFSWAQSFIVPGSCPNVGDIKLRTFLPLEIVTHPEPRAQKTKISWTHGPDDKEDDLLWLAYINQLNVPVVVPVQVISCGGVKSTAVVALPYDEFMLNDLTVAAVVSRRGPFANATDVAQSTVHGPALFIVE